jgi:hypothetical protein
MDRDDCSVSNACVEGGELHTVIRGKVREVLVHNVVGSLRMRFQCRDNSRTRPRSIEENGAQ